MALRKVFESKEEKVAGGWRRLHKEELHNTLLFTNIIRLTKSRMMRWEVHVARIGDMGNA
jgi:hypothetical protein